MTFFFFSFFYFSCLSVIVHNFIVENGYFHAAKIQLYIQFSMRIAQKSMFLCNTEYLLHKIGGFLHFSVTWVVEGCKLAYIIVANCATAYCSVF